MGGISALAELASTDNVRQATVLDGASAFGRIFGALIFVPLFTLGAFVAIAKGGKGVADGGVWVHFDMGIAACIVGTRAS